MINGTFESSLREFTSLLAAYFFRRESMVGVDLNFYAIIRPTYSCTQLLGSSICGCFSIT